MKTTNCSPTRRIPYLCNLSPAVARLAHVLEALLLGGGPGGVGAALLGRGLHGRRGCVHRRLLLHDGGGRGLEGHIGALLRRDQRGLEAALAGGRGGQVLGRGEELLLLLGLLLLLLLLLLLIWVAHALLRRVAHLTRRVEVHTLRHRVTVGVRYIGVLGKYRVGVLRYTGRAVRTRRCLAREVWLSLYTNTPCKYIELPNTIYHQPYGEVQRYQSIGEVNGEGEERERVRVVLTTSC